MYFADAAAISPSTGIPNLLFFFHDEPMVPREDANIRQSIVCELDVVIAPLLHTSRDIDNGDETPLVVLSDEDIRVSHFPKV